LWIQGLANITFPRRHTKSAEANHRHADGPHPRRGLLMFPLAWQVRGHEGQPRVGGDAEDGDQSLLGAPIRPERNRHSRADQVCQLAVSTLLSCMRISRMQMHRQHGGKAHGWWCGRLLCFAFLVVIITWQTSRTASAALDVFPLPHIDGDYGEWEEILTSLVFLWEQCEQAEGQEGRWGRRGGAGVEASEG